MGEPERRPEEDLDDSQRRPDLRAVERRDRLVDQQARPLPTSGFAAGGLAVSLLSLFVLGIVLAPIGVVLGLLGLNQISREKRTGKNMALAALILGSVSFIATLVLLGLSFLT